MTVAGGTPTLTLNDGGTATYSSGSGSNALTFSYTVGAGQNTSDLTVTAVNLNSATVTDGAGNAANLTGAVTNPAARCRSTPPHPPCRRWWPPALASRLARAISMPARPSRSLLNLSEAVTVAGGTPTLTLNDGGTATYSSGSGSNALTFSYTVGAGQNTSDLTVTAVNLNSATVTDGAGNAANLTGAVTNPAGTLQIDTTAPVISAISETPASGHLKAGKVVTYTLTMSEAMTVAGGTPTLTLNDGGTGTYVSGSGTSTLTFSYTVLAGQNTPDLMVSAVNLNGASVTDGAGTAANFSLSGIAQGSPEVDTTAPAVTAQLVNPIGSSNITLNPALTGSGDANAVVTFTEGSSVLGTTTADASGAWSFTPTGLASGSQTITASETDLAGNTGSASLTFALGSVIQSDTNAFGTTALTQIGSQFYLDGTNASGPVVQSGGQIVTTTMLGAWTPIGAVQTASGYEVAVQYGTANEYTIWTVNSSGAILADAGVLTGNSLTFEMAELVLNQDLNGDGMIGPLKTLIQTDTGAFGSTSLTEVGNEYFLYNSGGTGPALTIGGAAFTAGMLGTETPIGAVQTANGYEVAVQYGTTNQYTVWNVSSSGAILSNSGVLAGNSLAFEMQESVFQPGPQWRRNDRSAQDPHSDRHRRLRLNQPHRGWQRILPLQQRWHRSGIDHWRRGFHGGHARH